MKPEHFLAFDPGKTVGVGYWHPAAGIFDAIQTKDPFEALRWGRRKLFNNPMLPAGVTVEKYAGGGYKTSDGIYTTEIVGFYTYWFKFYFADNLESGRLELRTPISQQRLSGLDTAMKWAQSMEIPGPHSWDALAHALVHAREYEE